MSEPVTLSDSNFDATVLEADRTVLVDFWAPWCGPCRAIAPVVEQLAAERPGDLIGKLDVDQNPQVAARYNVMSIPTLLVFKNGQVVDQIVGRAPKQALSEALDRA